MVSSESSEKPSVDACPPLILQRAKAAVDAYDFADVLQPLSGADLRRIWDKAKERTETIVQQALLRAQEETEEEDDAEDEEVCIQDLLVLVVMPLSER